jgi:hypothetical protein
LQDYADVSALLYTLRVVLGDGGLPTRPPNSKMQAQCLFVSTFIGALIACPL